MHIHRERYILFLKETYKVEKLYVNLYLKKLKQILFLNDTCKRDRILPLYDYE